MSDKTSSTESRLVVEQILKDHPQATIHEIYRRAPKRFGHFELALAFVDLAYGDKKEEFESTPQEETSLGCPSRSF